jgi:hypothetical protein
MTAWAGHRPEGNGELLALLLRAGNAGSNTAAGHIEAALKVPASAWTPPYDGGGQVRESAWGRDSRRIQQRGEARR